MESEEQRALKGRRSRGRSKLEGGVGVASLKLLLGLPVGVLWGLASEADEPPDNNEGVLSFLTLVRRAESIGSLFLLRSKLENQLRCLLVNSLMFGLGPAPFPTEVFRGPSVASEASLFPFSITFCW